MSHSIQERLDRLKRLRRLGLKQGVGHIQLPPSKPPPTELEISPNSIPLHFLHDEADLLDPAPIEDVVPGDIIENAHGQYFRAEARYPLTGQHGHQRLEDLLHIPMTTIATITGEQNWHRLTWPEVLFLDLETTGLEVAAGTVAFLIGIGYLDGDDFVVRQVFMRDFDEEVALLQDLHALCRSFKAVVSFNGKTFDLPLLENRFVMARLFPDLLEAPHLDLLHPARRLWRRRLENCKLATIEAEVLGLERTQSDVPGYFIPSLYRQYLTDQNARPMAGIFYHNEVDIVSLASLTAVLSRHFALLAEPDSITFHPLDILSAGLWQLHLGQTTQAETILKLALTHPLPEAEREIAKTELAYLRKRQARYDDAEPLWQELVLGSNPLLALEELAKFYEWRRKDLDSALTCVDYALQLLADDRQTWQTADRQAAWTHRRARVQRKLEIRG